MPDNRFPSPGVDARFPSPGVDVRFATPGVDVEQLLDGTDTRFQGATYGVSDPAAEVAAMLSGTNGFALDPTDAATKWQTDDTSTPWTADGQAVGRLQAKFGAAPPVLTQATPGFRPLGFGRYIEGDGSDDTLAAASVIALQNAPYGFMAMRLRFLTLPDGRYAGGFSTNLSSRPRMMVAYQLGQVLQLATRRNDGDPTHNDNSTSGEVALGTDYNLCLAFDAAGTGNITLRKDGVDTTSTDFPSIRPGTAGNFSNTASTLFSLFTLDGTIFSNCRIGRWVVLPFQPTAGQITSIESYLTAGGALA